MSRIAPALRTAIPALAIGGSLVFCSLRRGSSLPAEELMIDIFRTAADFCQEVGFRDDVTILVVKCDFDGSSTVTS